MSDFHAYLIKCEKRREGEWVIVWSATKAFETSEHIVIQQIADEDLRKNIDKLAIARESAQRVASAKWWGDKAAELHTSFPLQLVRRSEPI